jgi:hypothetical protein
MGFLAVTAVLSGVAIFLGASVLGWIVKKAAPAQVANLSHVPMALGVVAVTTAVYMFVMTRPGIVGPYEQWTFEKEGGQLIGGMFDRGPEDLAGERGR